MELELERDGRKAEIGRPGPKTGSQKRSTTSFRKARQLRLQSAASVDSDEEAPLKRNLLEPQRISKGRSICAQALWAFRTPTCAQEEGSCQFLFLPSLSRS